MTSSLLIDKDAIDNEPLERRLGELDQADELADLLGGLGVADGKNCDVCFTK